MKLDAATAAKIANALHSNSTPEWQGIYAESLTEGDFDGYVIMNEGPEEFVTNGWEVVSNDGFKVALRKLRNPDGIGRKVSDFIEIVPLGDDKWMAVAA